MVNSENSIVQEERRRNELWRRSGDDFAAHRQAVMSLLLPLAGEHLSLAVVGAGNCNDIDLTDLAGRFQSVDLIDLDDDALAAAHAGLPAELQSKVSCQVEDISGDTEFLGRWTPDSPPSEGDVRRWLDDDNPPRLADARFDVVVSACLLSQLIDHAKRGLGQEHALIVEAVHSIRDEHLRWLVERTRPGGRVLLITDFTSSETHPPLATTTLEQLPRVAAELLSQGNLFMGLHPYALARFYQRDLAAQLHDIRVSNPWLWNLGPRVYAVCAIQAEKRRPERACNAP